MASRFNFTLTQSKSARRLRTAASCLLAVLLFTVAIGFFASPSPAYAIADPGAGNITIESVGAFANIKEQGDMLFLISYKIKYAVLPAGNASDYFGFYAYKPDGIELLGYYPAIDYGYRLTSMYFDASAVLLRGMVTKEKYKFRIAGTPAGFSGNLTEGVNMVTQDLGVGDWVVDDQKTSRAALENRILSIMAKIQTYDNATYLLQGTTDTKILSATVQDCATPCSGLYCSGQTMILGTTSQLGAIPNLNNVLPNMFEGTVQGFDITTTKYGDTYAASLTMATKLGVAFTNAFAGIGTYFGISTQWAAGIFWSIIMSIAAMIIFVYSGNSLAAMILVLPLLLMGNWLGIIPLVITFVLTILLVMYMGYHIYLRGMV